MKMQELNLQDCTRQFKVFQTLILIYEQNKHKFQKHEKNTTSYFPNLVDDFFYPRQTQESNFLR